MSPFSGVVQCLMDDTKKRWDEENIQDICNERDRKLIQQIPIPTRSKDDSWYWILDDKGDFTVQSCYRRIRDESACVDGHFWKKLWGLQLPGKVVNFLWRACWNVLPTAITLQSKQVNINLVCSWCHMYVEDAVHILFNCSIAPKVWCNTGLQELVITTAQDTVMTVLKRVFDSGNKDRCAMVGLLCWSLWSRRNKWVWDKVNTSVFGIKDMALNLIADWRRARQMDKVTCRDGQAQVRTWTKPPDRWVKVYIDAAYRQGGNHIGIECIVRDEHGHFLRARTNILSSTREIREAEAWSLRETLEWVCQWRINKCIFESDAKLLVDALKQNKGKSIFDTIVEKCTDIIRHFEDVSVVFISRYANMIAHLLAHAAFSTAGPREWFHIAPDFIFCNLALEAI